MRRCDPREEQAGSEQRHADRGKARRGRSRRKRPHPGGSFSGHGGQASRVSPTDTPRNSLGGPWKMPLSGGTS